MTARRWRAVGSWQAWFSAAFARCTISVGRPRGPNSPTQAATWKPGSPASSAVGTSGKAGLRLGEVTKIGRSRPSCTKPWTSDGASNIVW